MNEKWWYLGVTLGALAAAGVVALYSAQTGEAGDRTPADRSNDRQSSPGASVKPTNTPPKG